MSRSRARVTFVLAVVAASAVILGYFSIKTLNDVAVLHKVGQTVKSVVEPTQKVMTIGSSVTKGWMDTGYRNWRKGWHGGYLLRGFTSYDQKVSTKYTIVDKTIVGANSSQMATLYKGDMTSWLQTIQPSIVVISWGLLNDALPKTPLSVFEAHLHHEIANVLAHHAVVMIITPPVTQASLTTYKTAFQQYLQAEITTAQQFHSRNVYVFDVYSQMKKEMAQQHIAISQYIGNSWHPNAAGHEKAGEILSADLWQRFGNHPIHFES